MPEDKPARAESALPSRESLQFAAQVGATLALKPRDQAASRMARAAIHRTSEMTRAALHVIREQPVCSSGCGYCCHGTKVDVLVPEALAIAAHLRQALSNEALTVLRAKVAAEAARLRDFNLERRQLDRAPCVFLESTTERCTIYEVRPLACRRHHSLELSACTHGFEHPADDAIIPMNRRLLQLSEVAQLGFEHAIASKGLDAESYELTNALHVALDTDRAPARWLKGERLFEAARLPHDAEDREPR